MYFLLFVINQVGIKNPWFWLYICIHTSLCQERKCEFMQRTTVIREGLFLGSRQLQVVEMEGRAGAKKQRNETATKRSAGAVDDQKWSKIARPKKRNFLPLETNGRTDGNQKKASPTICGLCVSHSH